MIFLVFSEATLSQHFEEPCVSSQVCDRHEVVSFSQSVVDFLPAGEGLGGCFHPATNRHNTATVHQVSCGGTCHHLCLPCQCENKPPAEATAAFDDAALKLWLVAVATSSAASLRWRLDLMQRFFL